MKYFRYSAVIFFAVSLLLAVYRHLYIDELFSYQGVLNTTTSEILQYARVKTANNQLINSMYMHFMMAAGIRKLIFFRLLSLSSFVLFAVYYHKYLRRHSGDMAGGNSSNTFYLIICVLPFMLPYYTFFSLARGYALAIGSLMAAFYYFSKTDEDHSLQDSVLFTLFGLIAALSVFSFIYPFAAMLLLMAFKNHKKIIDTSRSAADFICQLILLLLIVAVTYYIYDKGKIITINDAGIAGGNKLLKDGMLSSLFSFMAFQDVTTKSIIPSVLFFVILKYAIMLTLIPTLIIFYRKRKMPLAHKVLIAAVVLIIASHVVLHAMYPFGRAICYLPLLLYVPLITTYIANKKERILYNIHFLVVIAAGCWGIFNDLYLAFVTLKK